MMVPVGRLVILRTVPKAELISALAWLTIPALMGPVIGPPLGGFITTYSSWRWIFWINIPIGILGIILATYFIGNFREKEMPPLDIKGFVLSGVGLSGLAFGFTTIGQGLFHPAVVAGASDRRHRRLLALCAARKDRAGAAPRSQAAAGRHVLRERRRRLPLSHRRRRHALSAAAHVAARLRHDAVPVGHAHFRHRHRRHRHEDDGGADPAPFRLQTGAGGERLRERGLYRRHGAVHARRRRRR